MKIALWTLAQEMITSSNDADGRQVFWGMLGFVFWFVIIPVCLIHRKKK